MQPSIVGGWRGDVTDGAPGQEQHHFVLVALLGLTTALGPFMLVLGAVDAWLRNIPGVIAFLIAIYFWIVLMFRVRHTASTRVLSYQFVGMMLAIGVITGWWYVRDPIPYIYLITAMPVAGVLLGWRGVIFSVVVTIIGTSIVASFHYAADPTFINHQWVTTGLACLVVGVILGGASAKLHEGIRAVPDPVTVRDFRRERELELQLSRAEKDRALGALARAVAHDFNNLLTPILASAEMASLSVDDPEVRDDLSAILLAGTEARTLVRTVLEFQREDSPVEQFDIGDAVKRIASLITHQKADRLVFKCTFESGMRIEARASDIQRIILNLVTNARRAAGDEGTITIGVSADVGPGEFEDAVIRRGEIRAGPVARIVVEDDGVGMDRAVAETIFDPFVTYSGGTGLGLATVKEIVDDLNGAIAVWSKPNEGSRFVVVLPTLCETPDVMPTVAKPGSSEMVGSAGQQPVH